MCLFIAICVTCLFATAVLPANDQTESWVSKTREGQQLQAERRSAEAERILLSALHDAELLGPADVAASVVLDNLGNLYAELRRLPDAEYRYRQALSRLHRTVGPDHPLFAIVQAHLAQVYLRLHRYSQAEQLLLSSLAIQLKAQGEDSPQVARIRNDLAAVYVAERRTAHAYRTLEAALAALERDPRAKPIDIGAALHNLAFLAKQEGNTPAALAYAGRAMQILYRESEPQAGIIIYTLLLIGDIHALRSDARESKLQYERALALANRVYGPESAMVADVLVAYASAMRKLKRRHEADKLASAARGIAAKLGPASGSYTIDIRALRREAEPMK